MGLSAGCTVTDSNPSFFARFFMAFGAFFRVLFDGAFAGQVLHLSSGAPEPEEAPARTQEPPAPKLREAPTESALQLLGLLQREGRLIDFLLEDVSAYSDADIGAAARVVHDQCRRVLESHVTLERVRAEAEGSRITLEKGFSASEVRLVGAVVGEAPFSGTLTHGGWRARSIELPKLSDGHDARVLAPAEVEL